MTETLFNLLNLLPLPIWLSMLLFPKAKFTQRLVLAYWPYIVLGSIYTALLGVALVIGFGGDEAGFGLSFASLRQGFTGEWTFLAGWAHYLALDLFVGVWIFRDAKYWGVRPPLYVLLTLFAGPLGLASYLWVRGRKTKDDPIRVLN